MLERAKGPLFIPAWAVKAQGGQAGGTRFVGLKARPKKYEPGRWPLSDFFDPMPQSAGLGWYGDEPSALTERGFASGSPRRDLLHTG
jgi:hypothetical protein